MSLTQTLTNLFACLSCRVPGFEPNVQGSQQPGVSRSVGPQKHAQPSTPVRQPEQRPDVSSGPSPKRQRLSTGSPEDHGRPKPSRGSSRARLDLPLEYVNLDPSVELNDGPVPDIMGRKSSFSVLATNENLGTAVESSSVPFAPSTPTASHGPAPVVGSTAAAMPPTRPVFEIGDITPPGHSPSGSSVSQVTLPDHDHYALDSSTIQPEAPLLGPQTGDMIGRKCLVLDLDETLVHSSFKYIPDADFLIPVEIDNRVHHVFVVKRPGVDEFLNEVGKIFEVVIFTASVAKYGDPLLDHLDAHHVVHHRLFRESCYNYNGNYIKNLSQLGRPLKDVIIIDNSPASYALQPQHAVPVSSWFSDIHDNELLDMLPFLDGLSKKSVTDVSAVLDVYIE